jgi:hypothetical protein
MSRNRILAVIFVLAFAGVSVWIAKNTSWKEIGVPMSLKGEAATNPFYSAQHFAGLIGAHTEWRHVLGSAPPQDSIIVLAHWHWTLIEGRRRTLEQWVAAGGRLVVDRTVIGSDEFARWTGITREPFVEGNTGARSVSEKQEHAPGKDDVHGKGCRTLRIEGEEVTTNPFRSGYELCDPSLDSRLLSLRRASWALRDADGIQAVRVDIGQGSVTMINASPFGNRELLQGEHGLMFVAATQLHGGDDILFLSDVGTSLLGLMWSDGAPALLLAFGLVGLMLWRGSLRFGPLAATPDPARRSLGEQIRGTGRFTVRFGGGRALHAAAVRALTEAANRSILGYARLSGDERIAALAGAANVEPVTLAEAVNNAGPRRPGELGSALALLEQARRAISRPAKRPDRS